MQVLVFNRQKRFPINHDSVVSLARQVVSAEGQKYDEVSINFVGTQRICTLHAAYFDDPSPTDCISFPMDEITTPGYRILGELFVCPAAALQFTKISTPQFYAEISLYVTHALLHLMGYDDIKEEDRMQMREKETFHMEKLKTHNLLIHP